MDAHALHGIRPGVGRVECDLAIVLVHRVGARQERDLRDIVVGPAAAQAAQVLGGDIAIRVEVHPSRPIASVLEVCPGGGGLLVHQRLADRCGRAYADATGQVAANRHVAAKGRFLARVDAHSRGVRGCPQS